MFYLAVFLYYWNILSTFVFFCAAQYFMAPFIIIK